MQNCSCGKGNRECNSTHTVGGCELRKEEQVGGDDNPRRTRHEESSTLDRGEKTIATTGFRWWTQTAKQVGDKVSEKISLYDGEEQ